MSVHRSPFTSKKPSCVGALHWNERDSLRFSLVAQAERFECLHFTAPARLRNAVRICRSENRAPNALRQMTRGRETASAREAAALRDGAHQQIARR